MDLPSSPAVVLTRARADNRDLAQALEGRGVPVLEIPCAAFRWQMPESLPAPGSYRAIAFTSRRGVRAMAALRLTSQLLPSPEGPGTAGTPLVAAVGKGTARELETLNIKADLLADPPEGRILAQLLASHLNSGERIAIIRGNLHAPGLDEGLTEAGLPNLPIVLYENFAPKIDSFKPFPVAAIFVAAPSAVERLLCYNPWMKAGPFYAIGPTTTRALLDKGIHGAHTLGAAPTDWVAALEAAYRQALELEKA